MNIGWSKIERSGCRAALHQPVRPAGAGRGWITRVLISALVAGTVLLAGCGTGRPEGAAGSAEPLSFELADAGNGPAAAGVVNQPIRGRVKFAGVAPKRKPIAVTGDKFCEACYKTTPLLKENLIVNDDNHGLQNAFVYIRGGLGEQSFAAPDRSVRVNIKNCRYEPHVIGVMVGQTVEVRSLDATTHSIHFISPRGVNASANYAIAQNEIRPFKFSRAELGAFFKDDIHAWMQGVVCVVDNPYFAVTNASGEFDLGNLPPGEYTVIAWHEDLGEIAERVTVTAGQPVEMDVEMKAK